MSLPTRRRIPSHVLLAVHSHLRYRLRYLGTPQAEVLGPQGDVRGQVFPKSFRSWELRPEALPGAWESGVEVAV